MLAILPCWYLVPYSTSKASQAALAPAFYNDINI